MTRPRTESGRILWEQATEGGEIRDFILAIEQEASAPLVKAIQSDWRFRLPDFADEETRERVIRSAVNYESQRHFFEPPDGDDVCTDCGEFRDADFVRIPVHFNDGDG